MGFFAFREHVNIKRYVRILLSRTGLGARDGINFISNKSYSIWVARWRTIANRYCGNLIFVLFSALICCVAKSFTM